MEEDKSTNPINNQEFIYDRTNNPEQIQQQENEKNPQNSENLENPENSENQEKKSKINLPKRKFAIIHGYNGHNFCGNQKNPDVRTVEEEMEKTLHNLGFISDCNFGVLQKIGWMRASRTDKKVSAIMNVVSCKLHKDPNMDEEAMKNLINENLPKDIKIFRMIEMSRTFDSKGDNNNREYHYILPSFMLEPQVEGESKSIDSFTGNFNYKISPEIHEKLKNICKAFKGTKKYHNYTKKLAFSDPSSNRHIYELTCDEIIEFDSFQAIKFKIIGQSFLYNQIRKMIGAIIDICRTCRDMEYLENSFLANKMDIPKAPAEGLYLRRIDYSRYNDRKLTKKNNLFWSEGDDKEMEDFRAELWKHIEKSEKDERSFSKWLWKFDNQKENTY
jgi:tRNA pseudouridine38-40 synthase